MTTVSFLSFYASCWKWNEKFFTFSMKKIFMRSLSWVSQEVLLKKETHAALKRIFPFCYWCKRHELFVPCFCQKTVFGVRRSTFSVFILYFLLLRTLLEFLRESPALSFPPLFLNQRQGTPSFFQVRLSSVQTKISVEASVSLFFLASKKRREWGGRKRGLFKSLPLKPGMK